MLKQSIEVSNEMIDEFRNMCSLYLDDISYVIYSNKNDSSICIKTQDGKERCSVLTVYIKSKMKYDLLNLDPVYGNWDDAFVYTKEVEKAWNDLLQKYKLIDEVNTPIKYLFFDCVENIDRLNIVHSSKDKVKELLAKQKLPKPAYLFACSKPGYYIILKNEKDYNQYQEYGSGNIQNEIIKMLNSSINMFDSDSLALSILHLKMPNINLYGLSRED